MSPSRVNAIGITTIVVAVVLAMFIGLDMAGTLDVHPELVTALTGLGSAGGVAYVACRLVDNIAGRILGRLDLLHSDLGTVAEAVLDYGENRITEEQLAALRDVARKANGHEPVRLRSVGE